MKQKTLDSLQKNISENIEKYKKNSVWVEQYFTDKETPRYYFETDIEIEDYKLTIGDSSTDFENAKIIYEAYKDKINPVQASDLRLWAYLAHVQHWDYMRKRWPVEVEDEDDGEEENGKKSPREKAIDRVKTRYFFGSKSFARHGIARLYWSAYLTYDENNKENPYEYTEFLFSEQDIFTSLLERSYARNKVIVLAALKALKKNSNLSRDDKRLFLAKLNQAGAITVLDFLDETQASELCLKLMDEVIKIPTLNEGSKFKVYNKITGVAYGGEFKIIAGKATILGKNIATTPKNLIGKREGSKIKIGDQQYVIKGIQ